MSIASGNDSASTTEKFLVHATHPPSCRKKRANPSSAVKPCKAAPARKTEAKNVPTLLLFVNKQSIPCYWDYLVATTAKTRYVPATVADPAETSPCPNPCWSSTSERPAPLSSPAPTPSSSLVAAHSRKWADGRDWKWKWQSCLQSCWNSCWRENGKEDGKQSLKQS